MMTKRQALGLILVFLLIGGGRVLRRQLMIGPYGQWRDPLPGETLLPPLEAIADPAEASPPAGPFAINRVSADTLCYLPGVGPVLAARIVEERLRAPFVDAEDLQRVKGIGPAMAAKIAPELIFTTAR